MKKVFKIVSMFLIFVMAICQISYAKISPSNNKNKNDEKKIVNQDISFDDSFDVVKYYQNLENAIVKNKKCSSLQDFIDNYVTSIAGQGGEWYVILFKKMYGDTLNYDKYKIALDEYVSKNKEKISKTSMQLIALSYLSIDEKNSFLKNICDETIGEYGIMSYIFGLHLLNNGLTSNKWTKDSLINKIVSLNDINKGYAFMGNDTDVDVTSMVLQALSPYYDNQNVKNIIDNDLNILSKVQGNDGYFINNGLKNSESISQVILCMSTLNIDPEKDNRFIKNNKNLYMLLDTFKTNNNLYSHVLDNEDNSLATLQAFYSLGSMGLSKMGKGNLFNIR